MYVSIGFQRKVFIRHAKVFPLYSLTHWKPNPHNLRRVVGTTEVVCGIILALIPGDYCNIFPQIVVNLVLQVSMYLKMLVINTVELILAFEGQICLLIAYTHRASSSH